MCIPACFGARMCEMWVSWGSFWVPRLGDVAQQGERVLQRHPTQPTRKEKGSFLHEYKESHALKCIQDP